MGCHQMKVGRFFSGRFPGKLRFQSLTNDMIIIIIIIIIIVIIIVIMVVIVVVVVVVVVREK